MNTIQQPILSRYNEFELIKISKCPLCPWWENRAFRRQVLGLLNQLAEESISARMLLHSISRERKVIEIHPHDLSYHLNSPFPSLAPSCLYSYQTTKASLKCADIILGNLNTVCVFPSKDSPSGVVIHDPRLFLAHELIHGFHFLTNSLSPQFEEQNTIYGSEMDPVCETQIAHELGIKGRSSHFRATVLNIDFIKPISFEPFVLNGKKFRPIKKVMLYEVRQFSITSIVQQAFGWNVSIYNEKIASAQHNWPLSAYRG